MTGPTPNTQHPAVRMFRQARHDVGTQRVTITCLCGDEAVGDTHDAAKIRYEAHLPEGVEPEYWYE